MTDRHLMSAAGLVIVGLGFLGTATTPGIPPQAAAVGTVAGLALVILGVWKGGLDLSATVDVPPTGPAAGTDPDVEAVVDEKPPTPPKPPTGDSEDE